MKGRSLRPFRQSKQTEAHVAMHIQPLELGASLTRGKKDNRGIPGRVLVTPSTGTDRLRLLKSLLSFPLYFDSSSFLLERNSLVTERVKSSITPDLEEADVTSALLMIA